MTTQLIFNADDFGLSHSINVAILKAHREGILTSASLMVAADACDEAVNLAQDTPSLAVGLHVVVVSGRSVLPPKDIPHLVNQNGLFPENPLVAGMRLLTRQARQELEIEMEAQFERFAATGLVLTHVDSHTHFHVHPAVFGVIVKLAKHYGARGLRMPHDDLSLALSYDSRQMPLKTIWALVFNSFRRLYLARLRKSGLTIADRVYGLMQTGQMNEAYVLKLLQHIQVRSAEIYFHPDSAAGGPPLGPNPGDLASLLSPRVRNMIEERQIQLATYASLEKDA